MKLRINYKDELDLLEMVLQAIIIFELIIISNVPSFIHKEVKELGSAVSQITASVTNWEHERQLQRESSVDWLSDQREFIAACDLAIARTCGWVAEAKTTYDRAALTHDVYEITVMRNARAHAYNRAIMRSCAGLQYRGVESTLSQLRDPYRPCS